jgi:hypothetical protein
MQSSYEPHLTQSPTPPTIVQKPGRFRVVRTYLRLLFRRFLYVLVRFFRWLKPFWGFALIIALLLLTNLWTAAQLWWPTDPSRDTRVAAMPQIASVQNYLRGQQTYNAELLWSAFSPAYQTAELQRGVDKSIMQTYADSERQQGIVYGNPEYIGATKMDNNYTMYIYAVPMSVGSQSRKTPFMFVVDAQGGIIQVQPAYMPTRASE